MNNIINIFFYNLYIRFVKAVNAFTLLILGVYIQEIKIKIIYVLILFVITTVLYFHLNDWRVSLLWFLFFLYLNIENSVYTKKHLNKTNFIRNNLSSVSHSVIMLGIIIGNSLNYY
jgi:hypothetical protein